MSEANENQNGADEDQQAAAKEEKAKAAKETRDKAAKDKKDNVAKDKSNKTLQNNKVELQDDASEDGNVDKTLLVSRCQPSLLYRSFLASMSIEVCKYIGLDT